MITARQNSIVRVLDYAEVLKPLPSVLLAFIGAASAVVAAGGGLSPKLPLVALAALVAAGGANGLTNYLDRDIDARLNRTRERSLPSGRISPPARVLPLVFAAIFTGLALAWLLHPLVFLADLVGTVVAATWRKKVTCVFPQGFVASCSPILMGWFAIRTDVTLELALLCVLIALWLPVHVWSVVISHRDEYLKAGLDYYPISAEVRSSVRVLFLFALILYGASILLYFAGDFSRLYLAAANILGAALIYASFRLLRSSAARDSWRLYKMSSMPYLGLLFLGMMLDLWL